MKCIENQDRRGLHRRHAYDRMFDLGRRRHLQTSRLSIDSGDPAAPSVDQLFSITYVSHRIIQESRGTISYSKIPVNAWHFALANRTLIADFHVILTLRMNFSVSLRQNALCYVKSIKSNDRFLYSKFKNDDWHATIIISFNSQLAILSHLSRFLNYLELSYLSQNL